MSAHEAVVERVEDLDGVVLISHGSGLKVGFAPGAGMIGYTFEHRGEQLLGLRDGLRAYRERGSTFGIPLLHPWANRLSAYSYTLLGRDVELDPERSPIHPDPNGLPIHGVLAGHPGWEVESRDASDARARLAARLDFGAYPELLAAFPFPHELRVEAELASDTLSVATTLVAGGEVAVPISFGWHPYLRLPGVPREEWWVEMPVRSRALLDDRGIPTGGDEPADVPPGPLGDRDYDDLFPELDPSPRFVLDGGGRRIEVDFGEGYPLAQVYAPRGEQFICFEPMTAPTDALLSGEGLRTVDPDERFRAEFRVRVGG